jgi:hypothetical protein
MENYLPEIDKGNTYIEYVGDSFIIKFEKDTLAIEEVKNKQYPLPQIMYVPAERNFISYVKNTKELKIASESLREFLIEFEKAKEEIKGTIKLPINNVDLVYDKQNDILHIKGKVKDDDYKVRLVEASSGFQSTVPLYLVSMYLASNVKKQSLSPSEPMSNDELERFKKRAADILSNDSLSYEQQRAAISVLSNKFNKMAFINIVEEPEQNLFPSSQKSMLESLLEFNNMNEGNKLIMTTHSPYLINYLTLTVKAETVKLKLNSQNSLAKLAKIVPLQSTIKSDDLVIYELNEIDGTIKKLEDYNGLPSDENYLNNGLEDSNELFAQLQELEKGWR